MGRVAVVTGSNKGIGYAIVKGLCKQFDGSVYLTARNPDLGAAAVKALSAELSADHKTKLKFHQLDIGDTNSITALKDHLQNTYGGLDILVNNAGIAYKNNSTAPFSEQAEVTLRTNYTGTKQCSNILFPLLRAHSRVVNVCSRAGVIGGSFGNYGDKVKAQLIDSNLTVDQLDQIANNFVSLTKNGEHTSAGFPNSAYGMSKAAEIALSRIQHRELSRDASKDIIVNWCCPGYVDMDMSSHKGHLTIEQGADTPLYLALLPPGAKEPRGKFIAERKELSWC